MSRIMGLVVVLLVGCACETAPAGPVITALEVGFITALHSAGPVPVSPGDKDVIFGTFTFKNLTAGDIEVRSVLLNFLTAHNPADGGVYVVGSGSPAIHLQNCRLRGWPELVIFMNPTNLEGGSVFFHDNVVLPPSQFTVPMDVLCDISSAAVDGVEGYAVEILNPEDVEVVVNGQPALAVITSRNGNPPQVAALVNNN